LLADGESVVDTLEGVKVWWTHSIKSLGKDDDQREESKFALKMHRGNKDFVMNSYLPRVVTRAMEHRRQLQQLYLYSNNSSYWECHTFKHPSTFDTLAMEPGLKARVKSDLQSFIEGQKFFRKVGRAWKRGYLLFGPPGTGKSSMIAAMANHLKYNIYDLELTQVCTLHLVKFFCCTSRLHLCTNKSCVGMVHMSSRCCASCGTS
jgi:chaperone BCS1